MRSTRAILIAAFALLSWTAARANERGVVIRASDLFAEPFIDAAKLGPLASNQPVTIVERKGGWLAIEAGGRRGWVRMLSVRLESRSGPGTNTAALRTGSTGRTVATGVKGLDEVDIANAAIDREQLARLGQLAVTGADARQRSIADNLKEAKVDYLKPGKVK